MKLTAAIVEKMQATERRQEVPDALCTGLYLIVQPSGKKGWQVRYRHGGTHRRMTIGGYPVLSLAVARQRAREVMAATAEGRDPSGEVKAAKASKASVDRDKIRSLIDQFEKRHLSTLKSGKNVRQQFDLHVIPQWGDRDVKSITKRDVIDLLDGLMDAGKATAANRMRAYLSKFFNWCASRDIIEVPPTMTVKAPAKEVSRDRVLSDNEVRWLWAACNAEGFPWGQMAKVLLLTGQRLSEVAQMTDSEISEDLWSLAASRTKNGRAHDVPLTHAVMDVFAGMGRTAGQNGFIFTTTGDTPVSGFGKARLHLDEAMKRIASEERGEVVDIPHWTFHDLRRTAATGMARLGIAVRVTEAVLNHVSGSGGGIVAVYQRHDYADEKRQALEAWARFVLDLVEGRAENVIRFRG